MKKIVSIFILILIGVNTYANEHYEYLSLTIKTLSKLNDSTEKLKFELNDSEDFKTSEKTIMNYVNSLILCANEFNKFTKSENESIKETSKDYKSLSEDIVKESYDFIIKSKVEKTNNVSKFIDKINFITGFYSEISLGVCSGLTRNRPEKYKNRTDLQFINLSQSETELIQKHLLKLFGNTIRKELNSETEKSKIERASRVYYGFLNMKWQYNVE